MDSGHGLRKVGSGGIRERSCSRRIGNDSGISAVQYHEQACLRGTVDAVVVRELREREPVAPICLSMIDKDSELLLYLLIHSFSMSIGLWVKGSGGVLRDVEHSVKLFHELGDKLGALVGDDDLRHSMLGINMVSENSAPAFG